VGKDTIKSQRDETLKRVTVVGVET